MSPKEVIFSPAAERELKKLTKQRQIDVIKALKKLQHGKIADIEKIQGQPSFFRIKAGREMRVIYHPLSPNRYVVLVVRDRKEAYRGLNELSNKLEATLSHIEAVAKNNIQPRIAVAD